MLLYVYKKKQNKKGKVIYKCCLLVGGLNVTMPRIN